MASGDAFHRAYTHATQQALLEAHELAFAYFGGRVPHPALRHGVAGEEDLAWPAAYRNRPDHRVPFALGISSEYCNPAKGNEKGGVEGELGWYRRNCLTPVPEAENLAALNEHLLNACVANRNRTIHGKKDDGREASEHEQSFPIAAGRGGFPYEEVIYPLIVIEPWGVVNQLVLGALVTGMARHRCGGPAEIEIKHDNRDCGSTPRGATGTVIRS